MSNGPEPSWLEKGSWVAGILGLGLTVIGTGLAVIVYFDGREVRLLSASDSPAPLTPPPTEASNSKATGEPETKKPVSKATGDSETKTSVSEFRAPSSVPLALPQRPTPKLPYLYKQRGRLDQGGDVYLRTPEPPTRENHGKQLEERYRDQLLENGQFSATMTTLPEVLDEGRQIYRALESRGIPVTIDEFPNQRPTYMAEYCCVLYYVPENHGFAAELAEEFTKVTGLNFVAEPGSNPPKDSSVRLVVQLTPAMK